VPIHVQNVAPTASFASAGPIDEGGAASVSFAGAFDPSPADTAAGFTYSFDFDGDGVFEVSGTSPTASHVFPQDGSFVVHGRVADRDGGWTEYATTVTVRNVAPVLTAFSSSAPAPGKAKPGQAVTVSGTFADAGVADVHTALIDWGDGTTSAAAVAESGGAGTLSAGHSYAQGGIYEVRVVLCDGGDSATGSAQAFVTGARVRGGVLEVVGTAAADRVWLSREGKGQLRVKADFLPGGSLLFDAAAVSRVYAALGSGADEVKVGGNVAVPVTTDAATVSTDPAASQTTAQTALSPTVGSRARAKTATRLLDRLLHRRQTKPGRRAA
jgi:hypothetical protein